MNQFPEMPPAQELLSTKLLAPQDRPSFIARPRLQRRLDQALQKPVTLVVAPAGFGKTTLAAEWIARRQQQNASPPLAWLSLDEGDNDPVRFWRYLLTACQSFGQDVARVSLGMLDAAQQPPFEALLTVLINDIAACAQDVLLALEDYHLITASPIHDTVAFLLENCPPNLHLLLLTRSEPPLPLARLRARDQLNEITEEQLRFTVEEVQQLMGQALDLPFSGDAAERLARRTEGWAAGLRLVALALQGRNEPGAVEQYLDNLSGSHRPILDYLIADVFDAQPPSVQSFLLHTSILDRLSPPLCDAVTGAQDSRQMLEKLERANLFIVRLRDSGDWYRYHALFAEAMQHHAQRQLGGELLQQLALKASRWYEENDMPSEAVEAALFAGAHERAAALIARLIAPRLVRNEFHTLSRWMERIPQEILQLHPTICMPFAAAILFTSPRQAPETKKRVQIPLQIAEAHWARLEDNQRLGEVHAFRSLLEWLQGNFAVSFAHAHRARKLLPDTEPQWRGISFIMLAVEALLKGDIYRAQTLATEALSGCRRAQNIYGATDSMLLLGEIAYRRGKLQQARRLFLEVITLVQDAAMGRDQAEIRRARAMLGLGLLHLEWNELDRAQEAVTAAVTVAARRPFEYSLADAHIALCDVFAAQGALDEAHQVLEALNDMPERRYLFRSPALARAHLVLKLGDLAAAERCLSAGQLLAQTSWPVHDAHKALLQARLHVAQGEAGKAVPILQSVLEESQAQGNTRQETEAGIQLSLAYAAMGKVEGARAALLSALQLGHSANHRRLFLDHGPALIISLREVVGLVAGSSQQPYPVASGETDALLAYARALLYAASQEAALYPHLANGAVALVDALTEQERRVLQRLAQGLSNPQIGEELFISVNTVKTHLKNIYAKLAVGSREEASETARRLGLV